MTFSLKDILVLTPLPDISIIPPEFKTNERYICIPFKLLLECLHEAIEVPPELSKKLVETALAYGNHQIKEDTANELEPKTEVKSNVGNLNDSIINFIKNSSKEGVTKSQIAEFLNKDSDEITKALKALRENNLLTLLGTKRASRYILGKALVDEPQKEDKKEDDEDLDSDDDNDSSPLDTLPGARVSGTNW